MRRLSLSLCTAFCALFTFTSSLVAQETPAPLAAAPPPATAAGAEDDSTRIVVREKTVYVPYEKLEDVFENITAAWPAELAPPIT